MKKIIIGILLFIIGAANTTTTSAQATPRVRKHQVNQQQRIHQGVATGELTRKEAVRLEMQQAKIKHDKRLATADGVVTPEERAIINAEQRRASRNIAMQKHDAQGR